MTKRKLRSYKPLRDKIELLMKEFNVSRDTATIIAYLDSIGFKVYEVRNILENNLKWRK